jgi:ribosomal protein S18 acetylase RimI-like enzyme
MLFDAVSSEAVGYALITSYWCNEEGGEIIVLDELYIAPCSRHKGYAKMLLDWMESRFNDSAAITLEVLTTNVSACGLYEKAGYKPDGYTTYTKPMRSR